MARRVRKLCPACQQLFIGRRDAKTCSERCRKRLQRARISAHKELMAAFGANANSIGVFDGRYEGKAMAARRTEPEVKS